MGGWPAPSAPPALMASAFTLLPPAPLVDAPLPDRLCPFLVACVTDARVLSPLLAFLSAHLPLPPSCAHLRRVRLAPAPTRVLLCASDDALALAAAGLPVGAPRTLEGLQRHGEPGGALARACTVLGAALCGVEEVRVPAVAPRAREACAAESAALWPMAYRLPHGSAAEAALRAAAALGSAEAEYFARGLRAALRQAREGGAAGFVPRGAAIYMGSSGGSGSGSGDGDPAHRGLGYSREQLLPQAAGAAAGAGAVAGGAREHPFCSAVVQAIEDSAARDRLALGRGAAPLPRRDALGGVGEGAGGSSAGRKRPREEAEGAAAAPPQSPLSLYLCTGCDAFLTHEPSIGDAMALVHARVSRVVYLHSAPAGQGAFEGWGPSSVRLHWVKALNHHFLVYKCTQLAEAEAEEGQGERNAPPRVI